LKRLLELGAPEIIVRNERSACSRGCRRSDRQRTPRAVPSQHGQPQDEVALDMLKGKQGRFRQNLLGKRVDYSGAFVIVVGRS